MKIACSNYPSSTQSSAHPTAVTSVNPSGKPSITASMSRSASPSNKPSTTPILDPSAIPSEIPTFTPSIGPSLGPSLSPSSDPSSIPTGAPSADPSLEPSSVPSSTPSTTYPTEVPSSNISCIVPSASPSNIALDGIATASCIHGVSESAAIDGNVDGNYFASGTFIPSGTVFHSCFTESPWWKVKLENLAIINKIIVWNRTDCCSFRLSNTKVQILDNNENVVEERMIGDANDVIKFEFDFDNVLGSYVKLQETDETFLQLAEVEVWGKVSLNSK